MRHHIPMYMTFDEQEAESVANYLEVIVNQTFTAYELFNFEDDYDE